MQAIETILSIIGILFGILFLLIICAFAVAGVIYLFGEQDDWTYLDDDKNK